MLGVLAARIELLNVRPRHALAARDAVLQVDILLVRLQIHRVNLARVPLGDRSKQAVLQLVTARLQIRRLRQEGERQLHIRVNRVIPLLLLNAIDDHIHQPPLLNSFNYKAIRAGRQPRMRAGQGSYAAAKSSTACRMRALPAAMSSTLVTRFSPAAIAHMIASLIAPLWCE